MYLRSVLLGAAVALRASAFLVVPEMEPQLEEVEDGFMKVDPMLLQDAQRALLNVPCTECPFREVDENGAVSWTDGQSSSLMLDFTVEDKTLLANGHQIFPPVPPSPIFAIQQREDGEPSDPIPVGYALEVMPMVAPLHEQDAELLDVRFTVLDLDAHPVPVNTVSIALIHDAQGNLYIAMTEIQETVSTSDELSWKQCHGKPKCLQKYLFARVRGLLAAAKDRVMSFASKASGRKGCHGKDKQHLRVHHGHHGHFGLEKLGRPHHHHQHHGYHGAFARTFSRVVRFIVVPAILGVLAGLTASAVGMLVGQVVVFLWRRCRGTKHPEDHKASWEQGEACEKLGLMTESVDDVLPGYIEEPTPAARGSMDKD